jgi:sigma-B regulation protein RsbU (phosphoserine phosphatase)
MRYRWKVLVLLLVIAMVPITVGRTLVVQASHRLGKTLISQSRENRIANMENRLQLIVDSFSEVLRMARENMETAILYQAGEVEHQLAKDAAEPSSVYFAEDFDSGGKLPGDLRPSSDHFRFLSADRVDFVTVSYSTQVFKPVSGVKKEDVASDIARLWAMTPVYKSLSKRFHRLIMWQYTSLENGLHTAYPGHGGIPAGYDHRKQQWYTEALAPQRKMTPWSEPYVDPVTRQTVIAATRPVRRANGEIAGVTALITPINSLLERPLLVHNIPPETRSFMSFLTIRPDNGQKGVQIIASDEYTEVKHRGWVSPMKARWLTSVDEQEFQSLIGDFEMGKRNRRRMRFEGCDCLWVYGEMGPKTFLVLITPYEEIVEPALKTGEYIESQIEKLVSITRYIMFCVVLLIVVLAFSFSRTVTKPIEALAEGARSLSQGNFDARVDIRSRDEFGEMGRVFNMVGPRLEENYKMRHSLELAMEVQQNFLPKADPKIKGFDISGKSIYCDETGGDYYDYLNMGESRPGRIGVVVGDVSDHGISSALFMASARAFIRQRSAMPGSLAEIVSDVNVQLTRDVEDSGQFMTLFYGEINMAERIFRWVRAGHDPAFVYDSRTGSFEELTVRGLALGVFEDSNYEESEQKIEPGQIIVIGTDGIWETHNSRGEMFGKKVLQTVIRSHADKPAREIIDGVIQALETFRHPLDQEDDVTLVVIKIEE